MEGATREVQELAHNLLSYQPLAKNGVIDKAFAKLQEKQIVRVNIEVLSMDSTSVKIHPDAAGAHKKTDLSPSAFLGAGGTPKYIWLPRAIE